MTLALLVTVILHVEPLLPTAAPLEPSRLATAGKRVAPSASVDDVKNCGACHRDIAAQWRTSAHALASFNNPLYRVSVERLRAERGVKQSRMCAGCHDLALLTSGAMDRPEISPDDERAHAGVSCTVCHSVVHATNDGNASATLRGDVALPSRTQDTSVAAHQARVASPTLRTAELCGTCHRAFLDEGTGNAAAFFGMDDYGAWLQSAWGGSEAERPDTVEVKGCRGCHMAREPAVLGDVAARNGTVPSHRFLGAHTTLGAMRGDADAVARTAKFLENSVSIDVVAARQPQGAWSWPASSHVPVPGASLELDVMIFNERTGHRFPGGVLDNQGTRVMLEVFDARGQRIASSAEHELRAAVVSQQGHELLERQTHEFVAAVWNHTVPSRDARVARFVVQVPVRTALPLRYEARVMHTARLEPLMRRACDDSRTAHGQAFAAASRRLVGQALDPCVTQPVTVVATSSDSNQPLWLRAYRHGLGLSVGLQEYLDDAQAALEFARVAAPDPASRAQVDWALGRLAGKRGQVDRALELLSRAERELGTHRSSSSGPPRWPLAMSLRGKPLLWLTQVLAMMKQRFAQPRKGFVWCRETQIASAFRRSRFSTLAHLRRCWFVLSRPRCTGGLLTGRQRRVGAAAAMFRAAPIDGTRCRCSSPASLDLGRARVQEGRTTPKENHHGS